MNFDSGTVTGLRVGLQLVTQYLLLAVELAHVVHAALEEGGGIHHSDALPE